MIPEGWADDRVFYEVLRAPVVVRRIMGGSPLICLVEPPRPGSFHACTVDDVCRILDHVPPGHLNALDLVVLRQPTRKQELLRPVWGRLAYHATIGRHAGTAIFLEAQQGQPFVWPASLDPEDAAELERLRADGHVVTRERRGWRIAPTPRSIRETQLHRTLLHELGHAVDWWTSVVRPSERLADEALRAGLARAYRSRPRRAKEDFAHRYAAEVVRNVPRFVAPLLDHASLLADGLDPAWFLRP